MKRFLHYSFSLLVLLLPSEQSFAQEATDAFSGFDSFLWDASVEKVQSEAPGTFESLKKVNSDEWNASKVSAYTGFKMGPEAMDLRFIDKNSEVTDYFFVQNKLCMVMHRPNMFDTFRPRRVLREMDLLYPEPKWRNVTTDLPIPAEFGVLSPKTDVAVTVTWENEKGRTRSAIRAMAPRELQQVYFVCYFSKPHSQNNVELLETWKKEQIAKAEAERKAREEEARKAKEEAQRKAETAKAAVEAGN